jgi:hypothetical protein
LPLVLAQGAAVIDGQRLDYGTHLRRLHAVTVADYLPAVPGDPYPHGVAQAILLSATGITDKPGQCRALLDLVAVLSPTGVPRQYLHQAGRLGLLHRSDKSGRRGRARHACRPQRPCLCLCGSGTVRGGDHHARTSALRPPAGTRPPPPGHLRLPPQPCPHLRDGRPA